MSDFKFTVPITRYQIVCICPDCYNEIKYIWNDNESKDVVLACYVCKGKINIKLGG